jgi:hypothetical protein
MEFNKIIFVITGLLLLLSAPAAAGWISPVPNIPAEPTKSIHTFELNRQSIVIAENEAVVAESEGQTTNENKAQAPNSETADKEKSDNNSNNAETKSIKPFKPSEEIAAEQAVDFPVDI